MIENDCEDHGFTNISDGCYNWRCLTLDPVRNQMVRPVLVQQAGHWVCPKCGGHYGAIAPETKGQK